jgi:mannose-6-phosphate isomerase-like protein (cupin superfamily)
VGDTIGQRRVITGLNAAGRSRIVQDGPTTTQVVRPDGSVVMDVWRIERLPTRTASEDLLTGEVLPPPPDGLVVRMCRVAPNTGMDAAEYEAALVAAYGTTANGLSESHIPGLHRTETLDVVTVIDGELVLVLESEETTLRPGDSVIQRGTSHAWHNRSEAPCLIVAVMMAAQ